MCRPDSLQAVVNDLGWQPRESYETFAAEFVPEKVGVVEAIVSSRSSLNGHTMRELKLRKGYSINPLAIMRSTKIFIEELAGLKLKPGDAILLQGEWDSFRTLQDETDLIYTEKLRGEEVREHKAPMAPMALVSLLILVILMAMLALFY